MILASTGGSWLTLNFIISAPKSFCGHAWLHHSGDHNSSAENTSVKGSVKAAFPSVGVLAPLGGQGRGKLSFSVKNI